MTAATETRKPRLAYGHEPAEVFEAMRERRDWLLRGEPIDDGRKLALVLEGGGMRAAGPAGAVVRLAQLGYDKVFDEVYATSAGVMNAAYFLSDQTEMGITIYHDDLASSRFVTPWRVWKIMDLDWVFRDVICGTKPLDLDSVLDSRADFFVSATEFRTGRPLLIDLKRTPTPPLTILKAAMAIPLLYNRTVPIEGVRCFDGGLLNPFPIHNAIARGCTHALVLLSRDYDYIREPYHPAMSAMFDWLFARGSKSLRGMLTRYPEVDRRARDIVLGRTPVAGGTRIATLCPPSDCALKRSTTAKDMLAQASMRFGDQMESALKDVAD